ncbi:MAG: hypothetical protein Q8K32_22480 [Archangium sp.]|nr:hypothetical protein [Archangium sp.]
MLRRMVSAGVVAVAMMLGSHFEAPREAKFRLLAQAPEAGRSADQRELDALDRTRPSLVPGVIVLSAGAGAGLLGVLFIGLAFIELNSFAGTVGLIAGLVFVPTGAVAMVVGVVMLIVAAIVRGVTDDRLRELRSVQPGAERAAARGFVLARF